MNKAIYSATLACMLVAPAAHAQDSEITIKSTEVSPGLFMLEGAGGFVGGNMGLLTGSEGVILIDDGLEAYSALVLGAVEDLAGAPANYVINTHVHGDHVGSNEAVHMTGAIIVAHNNIQRRLLEDGWPSADGNVPTAPGALPEVTFSDSMTFFLNDHTAYVFHIKAAHTDGDAAIHFSEQNVMYTGDVFFNSLFPYIDLDNGGTVDGYIAGQRKILSMINANTKVIPGHGSLGGKADLQAALDMLIDARNRVQALLAAGSSEEQIVEQNPLADYHDQWNWGFITTERMTRTLVRDLSAAN